MVGPERRRLLTPSADVDSEANATEDNRQSAQTELADPSLPVSRRGANEADAAHMDDPHGTAAMALTALSLGVGVVDRDARRMQMLCPRTQAEAATRGLSFEVAQRNSSTASVTTFTGQEREAQVDSVAVAGSIHPEGHQFYPTTSAPSPPQSVAMTSSLLTATMSSTTSSALDPPLQEFGTTRHTPHVPGERMQSLSYMLKDRLSLASFSAERGWEEIHTGLVERPPLSFHDEESSRVQEERPFLRHPKSEPALHRPGTRQSSISTTAQSFAGDLHMHDGDQEEQERELEHRSQLMESLQSSSQPYDSTYHLRETRPFIPLKHYTLSPTVETDTLKSKRKYTKKPSIFQSMLEVPNQAEPETKQESDLLQSDRGLILKTQIPKKGRPISKHSSTPQSTPTLSSFGVLPASHPYFSSKTGISSPSLSISGQYPPVRPIDWQQSPPTSHPNHSSTSMDDIHLRNPVRRRPGRPPLASTIARHAHSQSHSTLQSGPFSVRTSQSQLAGSSHEYDLQFQYRRAADPSSNTRAPLPFRVPSPPPSVTSSQRPLQNRHSYPLPQERRHNTQDIQNRLASSPVGHERSGEEQYFQSSTQDEDSLSLGAGSFAEGILFQTNSRKRDSYGTEKRRSTNDYYRYDDEKRSMPSVYDTDDREQEQYYDRFEQMGDRRSRKRLSRSDLDMSVLERSPQDENRIVQTWLGSGSERHREHPRSLVLPRGRSDSSLQSITATAISATPHHREMDMHERGMESYKQSEHHVDHYMHHSSDLSLDQHTSSSRQELSVPGSRMNLHPTSPPLSAYVHPGSSHGAISPDEMLLPPGVDYQGYDAKTADFPTALKAERLVHEMSAVDKSQSSTLSGQIKAAGKRAARKGSGPYLKKHQILQQQLHQLQREQEDIEVQMALKYQHQHQHQQRQHWRNAQVDPEFYPQLYHHQLQQQQPQPRRLPKQRALMRSESASSAINSLHTPSGSIPKSHSHPLLQQSQQQQQQPPSQQPSQARRRQNHHQPILLRPVSLPSLTDSGSSSLYYNQPPPGQPLYRSLHAPYSVSPSSLVSIASNASTGTASTLHTAGAAQSPTADFSQAPSPIHSPTISLSTPPPFAGPNLHSPQYGQHDMHGYSQHPYHHHRMQQHRHHGSVVDEGGRRVSGSGGGGTMSQSSSRGGMSASSSGTTLVHSTSQQSLHRHSASLPDIPLSQSQQQHQYFPSYVADPTRSPVHRLVNHTDVAKKIPPPLHQTSSSSTLPRVAPSLSISDSNLSSAAVPGGDDEPVRSLLVKTPPRDV
ncbi:hypothetical protein EDD21DRAFT_443801 [Dissophora ornata]|nr:hypothetical protein EDD21DRAFT_443801 [Dissophora ornata]